MHGSPRFGGGVPGKQYRLIQRDGLCICKYAARTFDAVARTSHLRHDNYFYYNCLTGRYARDNCPAFLEPRHFAALREGLLDRLEVVTGTFLDQLQSRSFTKVKYRMFLADLAQVERYNRNRHAAR